MSLRVLVAESTQRKNKLTAICDEIFPEFTQVFKDPDLLTALALRKRFPTPAAVSTTSLSALQEVRGKNKTLSDTKLLELPGLAQESIGAKDPAWLRGLTFEQGQLIAELGLLHSHLSQVEIEMSRSSKTLVKGRY